jgi:hypothetical protein
LQSSSLTNETNEGSGIFLAQRPGPLDQYLAGPLESAPTQELGKREGRIALPLHGQRRERGEHARPTRSTRSSIPRPENDRGARRCRLAAPVDAFSASDRSSIDAFYEAAMAAGGRDNGPPGVREHYHPNYYAAYVHDAEAVHRAGGVG